jgi:hypothetical protein
LNEAKKPQFAYCKLEDLQQLETWLKSAGKFSSIIDKNDVIGQIGQKQTLNDIDPKLKDSNLNLRMAGPLGFEPRTFSLEG